MARALRLILVAATLSTGITASPPQGGAYCVEYYSPLKGVEMVMIFAREAQSTSPANKTVELYGVTPTEQIVRVSAWFNASLPTIKLLSTNPFHNIDNFVSQMGLPVGFFNAGDTTPTLDGHLTVIFGEGPNQINMGYRRCYLSLIEQNSCSHHGYEIAFGFRSDIVDHGVIFDRTCTISKDGTPLGKFVMNFHDSDYASPNGFRITLVRNSTTDIIKLLMAFDPNFEQWLKPYGSRIYPSEEKYWISGQGISYHQMKRQLVVWLVEGVSLGFTPC
ncbi:hypothetical protein FOL47_004920 [Perkinsus chesapeaki]|uniref:Uncharacterized protein n=1 Tax=Perkinsus chesapeaki TaxID=330153 RepID=A0A7J6M031_PERCH|nr:hypothetical protein FOL47_004920 [Perkinsus chesapeaki]